jgi:hypothetical protein
MLVSNMSFALISQFNVAPQVRTWKPHASSTRFGQQVHLCRNGKVDLFAFADSLQEEQDFQVLDVTGLWI